MKKLIILLLVTILLLGCETNKDVITGKTFEEILESNGFVIADITDQYGEGIVEQVLLAQNGTYQIEFYIVPTEEQAKNAFLENKETFENVEGTSSSNGEVNIGNYSTYTRTVGDMYLYVARVDNTFIYLAVDKSDKKEVKDIVDELGY